MRPSEGKPDLGPQRPCRLCGFFVDMCQPALLAMAPETPPIPVSEAANILKISENSGFLDLCPLCVQLTQAFLQAKAIEVRNRMTEQDPDELARVQARSRILMPGQPGFKA